MKSVVYFKINRKSEGVKPYIIMLLINLSMTKYSQKIQNIGKIRKSDKIFPKIQ